MKKTASTDVTECRIDGAWDAKKIPYQRIAAAVPERAVRSWEALSESGKAVLRMRDGDVRGALALSTRSGPL
jgi:hypothetical protein